MTYSSVLPDAFELAFQLQKAPPFRALSLDALIAIAEKLDPQEMHSQSWLFKQGEPAKELYFILSGTVEIIDNDMRVVEKIRAHDVFGEEALFGNGYRNYSAYSLSPLHYYSLSDNHSLNLITASPSVSLSLLQSYGRQINYRHRYPQF